MLKGRRIAFDYGDVRIGVAVSDRDGILATPVTTLETKKPDLWDRIFDLLAEYEPIEIYVGRPVHLAGHASDSTTKAELFAAELQERFDLIVTMIDERLSTVSAQRQLREAGRSAKDSRSAIDQAAAVAILELALDIEKNRTKRGQDG
ncbi:MAG: Holliday junction resolvase RuvX [Actinomycetota bacterium]